MLDEIQWYFAGEYRCIGVWGIPKGVGPYLTVFCRRAPIYRDVGGTGVCRMILNGSLTEGFDVKEW